jgi:phosphoserine phosphatase RsbU/P
MNDSDNPDVVGFLYIMEGTEKGRIIKLYMGRNTVGTSSDCQIILDDPAVSAKHASIRIEDGGETYQIRDLDSQNGTYVQGENIVRTEMQENDEVVMGQTKMKFKML